MFALLPLPPTDHQLQRRRLHYEYGEAAMPVRQRHRMHLPTTFHLATQARLAMSAMLIRVGERLLTQQADNQLVADPETAVDPGTVSQ